MHIVTVLFVIAAALIATGLSCIAITVYVEEHRELREKHALILPKEKQP